MIKIVQKHGRRDSFILGEIFGLPWKHQQQQPQEAEE